MASSKILKIDKKIVGFRVKTEESDSESTCQKHYEDLTEETQRPDVLIGSTYKIKPPSYDYSIYMTINDVVLNEGTENEIRRPYEVFLNSKHTANAHWVAALTRLISAVFRKGGNVTFIVDQLTQVFDANGGHWTKRHGKSIMAPSIVAEIGYAIEDHFIKLGMLPDPMKPKLTKEQKEIIEQKKEELGHTGSGFPDYAQICAKCGEKAMVQKDNCNMCLNCGDSKCG